MNFDQQHVTRSPPIGKRICLEAIRKYFVTCDIKESHSLNKIANVILKPHASGYECKTERWKINQCIDRSSLPDKELSLKCTLFLCEPLIHMKKPNEKNAALTHILQKT